MYIFVIKQYIIKWLLLPSLLPTPVLYFSIPYINYFSVSLEKRPGLSRISAKQA